MLEQNPGRYIIFYIIALAVINLLMFIFRGPTTSHLFASCTEKETSVIIRFRCGQQTQKQEKED
jgi:hypothetical protein